VPPRPVRIGVLAVQGGFAAHVAHLSSVGARAVEVRLPEEAEGLDGLILPGGESTTIMMGIEAAGLEPAIRAHHEAGMPILGTCAGMIISDRNHLGLIDITTKRNAFGRQLASFEDDIDLEGIEGGPVRGVFIRAPRVVDMGPQVRVLAEHEGVPVVLEQGNLLVASFHPELIGETGLHRYLLSKI